MPYVVLFAAGLGGLVVMMVLGFAHAPHHHARGHVRVLPRAPSAKLTVEHASLVGRGVRLLGTLLSPLTWFSWMIGAGATGAIATLFGASPRMALLLAIMGALAFQLFVVRPIWKIVFRFESVPAGNLEGCLMQKVEVVRAFNARGEGLVRVVIDGRSEDLLAILTKGERAVDSRPRRGDHLVIEEVDPKTNTCFVSRS
ncbi:MAG TPA: hypothetical protein VGH87_29945 [Polyangiaceae bacterium]